ncbi:glycine-rich domain-containing protein [Lysinibacillus sp. M3]|uniref:Glycine-rich domain-containing protein n=1 Tax=Lysinibacillus zambalensis TaxID=3160866 RepID=A0ABV1MTT1_9BACI
MANLTGTPTYVNVLRQLETTDPAHPNTWNPNYQALLNNDAYLKGFIEGLMKAATGHTHSGVDGDGAKIPISSLKEDIVTQAELNAHIGSRGSAHAIVTTTEDGFMSKTDKSKLDGIAAGANNYSHPANHPPSIITQDANNRFVTDAEKATWNGKAPTTVATTSANGLMSTTDKSKLDGIAAGANNYSHPANHPPSIITQDANNRFVTDAEKGTWNAKETTAGSQAKANAAETNAKGYTDQKLAEHSTEDLGHTYYCGIASGDNALVLTVTSLPVVDPNAATPVPKDGVAVRFRKAGATNTGNMTIQFKINGKLTAVYPLKGSDTWEIPANTLSPSVLYTVAFNGISFFLQGSGSGVIERGGKEFTTPGSYAWTVPKGIYSVLVVLIGGGGGGGGFYTFASGGGNAGGGGGSGGTLVDMIAVTPGESINIQVGTGGLGGSNGWAPNTVATIGNTGGQSSFKTSLAYGGQGGFAGTQYGNGGGGNGGNGGGYGGNGQRGTDGVGSSSGLGGKNPGDIGNGGNTSNPGLNGKVSIKW